MTVTVSVRNSGDMEGQEVVMMYMTELFAYPAAEYHLELKRFKKVRLAPGESVTVEFTLSGADFRYLMGLPATAPVLKVKVGSLEAPFAFKSELASIPLSEPDVLPEVSTRVIKPMAPPMSSSTPASGDVSPSRSDEPAASTPEAAAAPRGSGTPSDPDQTQPINIRSAASINHADIGLLAVVLGTAFLSDILYRLLN
jgi:hypothetical protein